MPMKSYAQFHVNETARAARAAHARLSALDAPSAMYVYYRPMQIEAFPDEGPPGLDWTLAFPERIPTNLTADQMVQWFAARTSRLPYLTELGAP